MPIRARARAGRRKAASGGFDFGGFDFADFTRAAGTPARAERRTSFGDGGGGFRDIFCAVFRRAARAAEAEPEKRRAISSTH